MSSSFHHLFIVNGSGGLIFNLPWGNSLAGNDALRIASTFHSLYAIAVQLEPPTQANKSTPHNGMTELETVSLSFKCFQSITGIKFFATADPTVRDSLDSYLQLVYELYVDFVLKDPFYEIDMPIRVEKFETRVIQLTKERFGQPANSNLKVF